MKETEKVRKESKREPSRDCKLYKTDTTCAGLLKMVCREKDCKFYKSIYKS